MAGAGKSSIGKKLANYLKFELIDSDQLIETQYKESLQSILDKYGYIKLRKIEESVLSNIDFHQTILAIRLPSVSNNTYLQCGLIIKQLTTKTP